MRSTARCFDELQAFVAGVPLIDCHDHSGVCGPNFTDALHLVTGGFYFESDLLSASSDEEVAFMRDAARTLEERWPTFERVWRRTCYTGYAQATRRMLQRYYGESALSLAALQRLQGRMTNLEDPAVFEKILDDAKIAVRLVDVWPNVWQVLDGTLRLTPRARLVIGLPGYHRLCDAGGIQSNVSPLGRTVTSLDEYVEACREIFTRFKAFGAVAFKDQSAYTRTLAYGNPTHAEAETIFNALLADPRRTAAYPEGVKPLDDYLFHAFLRMARDLDLPVQIHTGHMAGIRNEIRKTNAVLLTSVLELHREVRFDLFHANWPYSGELLFLAKNYPNVSIDFCWANIIDPIYCQQLFKQAISSVPHGKIHGYGSDFGGNGVEMAWAHAAMARENIAIALADLVEMEYFGLDDAKAVAQAWLFDNAQAFFRLG